MRLKAFFINLLIMLVSVLLFLGALEIVLRVIEPKDQSVGQGERIWQNVFKFYEYDPLLGWRNKPGAEGVFQVPDTTTFVRINSRGMRDVEHSLERDDRYRILVLGDSFVWGYGVEQGQRFTDYLQELLGDRAEVINAGVSGYGTDQELLYYKAEGLRYSPDLVILAFGTFDAKYENLQSVAHTYPKPYFTFDNSGLTLRNVPVPQRDKRYEWDEKDELEQMYREMSTNKMSANKRIRKFLRAKFRAYGFISDGIKDIRKKIRDSFKSNPKILDYMVREKSREKEDAFFGLTEEIVRELNKEVKFNDSTLAVLMVTYRSHLRKLPDSLYGKMIDFCDSQDILCIDPYMALFDHHKKGKKLYFDNDEHWNSFSHRLVAEEIYSFLIKNKLVE